MAKAEDGVAGAVSAGLPAELAFLVNEAIPTELRSLMLQAHVEREKDERAAAINAPKQIEEAKLSRLTFWHNTPLVVALVGVITLTAQFASTYFLSNQTSAQDVAQDRREFSYRIMETELGKTDPLDAEQRANTLLFLAKAGVLDGLNVVALEQIALGATQPEASVSIPSTIGQSTPIYDLPLPAVDPGQTAAANQLHILAVTELNADVDELESADRVATYWSALDEPLPGVDATTPWSGAFIAWLVRQVGNPDGLALSAAHMTTFYSGRSLGIMLGPDEPPLPGDIVYYVRSDADAATVLSEGRFVPGTAGVVHEVVDGVVTSIGGNVGNGIRLMEHPLDNPQLLGYLRIGRTVASKY